MDKNDKKVLQGILEALDGPKEVRDEDDWLEYIQMKARQVASPPGAIRRRQPKVTRMQSARQRQVTRFTDNNFKAGMQSAEEAERPWERIKDIDESVATREVGPHDLPIRYSHGKETGYRSARDH